MIFYTLNNQSTIHRSTTTRQAVYYLIARYVTALSLDLLIAEHKLSRHIRFLTDCFIFARNKVSESLSFRLIRFY